MGAKSLSKFEEERKNGNKSYFAKSNNDEAVYVNDDFEKELAAAMKGDFVELPDSTNVRGNPNMSSDEFLNMCIQNEQQLRQEDDLDIIEID